MSWLVSSGDRTIRGREGHIGFWSGQAESRCSGGRWGTVRRSWKGSMGGGRRNAHGARSFRDRAGDGSFRLRRILVFGAGRLLIQYRYGHGFGEGSFRVRGILIRAIRRCMFKNGRGDWEYLSPGNAGSGFSWRGEYDPGVPARRHGKILRRKHTLKHWLPSGFPDKCSIGILGFEKMVIYGGHVVKLDLIGVTYPALNPRRRDEGTGVLADEHPVKSLRKIRLAMLTAICWQAGRRQT